MTVPLQYTNEMEVIYHARRFVNQHSTVHMGLIDPGRLIPQYNKPK